MDPKRLRGDAAFDRSAGYVPYERLVVKVLEVFISGCQVPFPARVPVVTPTGTRETARGTVALKRGASRTASPATEHLRSSHPSQYAPANRQSQEPRRACETQAAPSAADRGDSTAVRGQVPTLEISKPSRWALSARPRGRPRARRSPSFAWSGRWSSTLRFWWTWRCTCRTPALLHSERPCRRR